MGLINKKSLLILNYAKLNINENQLTILLLIIELSNEDAKSFTPTQLANYMSISKEQIEYEMSELITSKLVIVEVKNKKSVINLIPLFTKILIKLDEQNSKIDFDDNFNFIEKTFDITLSEQDINNLELFISKGISKQKIRLLIHEKTINNIEDLIKELNNIVKKNQPLKITKYNWLND